MIMHGAHHKNTRGFTLVELLIGLAIFTTIMAGVTVMFNSAVRTTKQGYQNQRAFENIRGAFSIIEEDLTRSFGSRATGHDHTFYGTPFGFTFIGLIPAEGEDFFNTARITYVVYADPDYASNADTETSQTFSTEATDELPSAPRRTYSLLRYVEVGQDDLDSYPVNWNTTLTVPGEAGVNMQGQIDTIINGVGGIGGEICASASCREEMDKALKRQYWMRMLAGDHLLPRFWDNPAVRTDGSANRNPADYVVAENLLLIDRYAKDEIDYQLAATDFPYDTKPERFDPDDLYSYQVVDYDAATQREFDPNEDRSFMNTAQFGPYTLDMALSDLENSEADVLDADSVNLPVDPLAQSILFKQYIYDQFISPSIDLTNMPQMNTRYFFAYREYDAEARRVTYASPNGIGQVDNEGNFVVDVSGELTVLQEVGATNVVAENEIAPRHFTFWNDIRNLHHNYVLNEVAEQWWTAAGENQQLGVATLIPGVSTAPDIINAALPESVLLEFAVFYPSAYPGAADFERVFTHRVDLPTAHRRKTETQWTRIIRDAEDQ